MTTMGLTYFILFQQIVIYIFSIFVYNEKYFSFLFQRIDIFTTIAEKQQRKHLITKT